ncbi:MAG: hypothetical protein ACLFUL_04715 [Desulfobacteraceae bacterium]
MAQEGSGQELNRSQGGISERACLWGAGGSATLVCLLNYGAGQWSLTKTAISLAFLAFAIILPLIFPRWYTKVPIFLHIFRHAIPAVIIGVIAGSTRRDRAVMVGGLCAAVIPAIVVVLTLIAYMTGAYTSKMPVWLYTLNWALGIVYWFFGAAYSASSVMGYRNRKKGRTLTTPVGP